ncbi:hypothetical protein Golob_013493 [Gossypium lobatum]|uniref:Uncharacterized protein n=1 Tax=Gossypium lobatum TaxID=34289 RepID=A0A7J8LPM3_9ROSI|nr:hypothetical protein [Gossypium lobatum]
MQLGILRTSARVSCSNPPPLV